jgi:large subunit ribosomal protein L23
VKDIHDVIRRPVISEKSYEMLDENKYTFIVDPRANKTHIKQAVEKIFDVKVLSVNTMNRRGKRKRRGLIVGKRPDTKRAIVTVAPGDRIELFDAGL